MIISNKIKCKHCGDIVESTYKHDFVSCNCKKCSVDGGKDYLRRCGYEDDYEDLSVVEFQCNKCKETLQRIGEINVRCNCGALHKFI